MNKNMKCSLIKKSKNEIKTDDTINNFICEICDKNYSNVNDNDGYNNICYNCYDMYEPQKPKMKCERIDKQGNKCEEYATDNYEYCNDCMELELGMN